MSYNLIFIILWVYFLIQNALSVDIDYFTILTDASNAGDGTTILTVSLYWSGLKYNCSFTPTVVSTTFTCYNRYPWNKVATTQLSYSLQFNYDNAVNDNELGITRVTVYDTNGVYYEMEDFCIHSTMSCTYSTFLTAGSKCIYYDTKDTYSGIILGGDSKFKLLYADFRGNIESDTNFQNTQHEGSVRPPDLVQLGVTYRFHTFRFSHYISAQWDNKYYRCTPGSVLGDGKWDSHSFNYHIDETKQCGGVDSDFWISVYANRTIVIDHIRVIDEAGVTYEMSQFCHADDEAGEGNYVLADVTTEICSSPLTSYVDAIAWKDGVMVSNLEAFLFPDNTDYPAINDCIFNYPDVYEPNIDMIVISADGKKGWSDDQYGGKTAITCPTNTPTNTPTAAPTITPTYNTYNPTITPTVSPITPSPVTPWPTTTRKPSILLNTESDKGMGEYGDIDSTEPVTGTWVFIVLGVAGCCCILAGVIYMNTQKHTHIITLISTKIKPKQCKVEKIENNIEMNETDYGNVTTGAFYATPEEPEGNVEWMFGTSQRTNMTQ